MDASTTTKPVQDAIDCEKCLLGAMLRDEWRVPEVRGLLRPEDFFVPAHRTICRAMFDLTETGEPNLLAVKHVLKSRGELQRIGQGTTDEDGKEYLVELMRDWGWGGTNIAFLAKAVRGAGLLGQLCTLGTQMVEDAKSVPVHDAGTVLEEYQRRIYELGLSTEGGSKLTSIAEATDEAIRQADLVHQGKASAGLVSGFSAIDRPTGGMQPGDLWTLAGATSSGKSSLAATIAKNVAMAGGSVMFVSLEMNKWVLANRLLASCCAVGTHRLKDGNLSKEEAEAREVAAAERPKWNLDILTGTQTVGEIKIHARQLTQRWGKPLDLLVIDYLHLVKAVHGKEPHEKLSGIVWDLKQLAMQLQTPVLMLSQFNREGVKHGNPPSLYSLLGSGSIENHSDVVLLLHQPPEDEYDTDGVLKVWLSVAKARNGETVAWPKREHEGIRLRFRLETTAFESMEPESRPVRTAIPKPTGDTAASQGPGTGRVKTSGRRRFLEQAPEDDTESCTSREVQKEGAAR